MKLTGRQNFLRFFAGLAILSVTLTQGTATVSDLAFYGCLVFGRRSCLQTMYAATRPIKASTAAGNNPASSFIYVTSFFKSYSSGVSQVPTSSNTRMSIPVPNHNLGSTFPETIWPIKTIEIKNSDARPRTAAKYFCFAPLSLTTQAYHTFSWRTTEK